MGVIGTVDMLGWITAVIAILAALASAAQLVRLGGRYEQRFIALEAAIGPDFAKREGRDDERWRNLFERLSNFDARLKRIEENGKVTHV